MRSAARIGAAAGAVTVFLALVGLIGNFTSLNLVGTWLTFGLLMLLIAPVASGFAVARARIVGGERVAPGPRETLVTSAVAGAVAGTVAAVFVLVVSWIGVERVSVMFFNVTEAAIEFMTFGQPLLPGVAILVAVSVLAAMAGGAYRLLPDAIRRPVGSAVVGVLLMGFLQRIIPIAMDELGLERDWLYSRTTRGLTNLGAVVVAAVAAGLSILKARKGAAIRRLVVGGSATAEADRRRLTPAAAILLLLGLAAVLVAPYVLGTVISEVLGTVMVFALLGLGLNIVVGYAGLLDLGYVFFFAVGAYSLALLTGATLNRFTGASEPALSGDLSFYVAVPIVMLIAAGAGLLIGAPVLRLRGDYLALVTLGLGEMITVLLASPWLEPLVGGPQGMRDITNAALGGFGFRDPQHFYYLALAFVVLALFVSWRLINSRVGRAWTALREDEQVADAMGVSTVSYKLLAFAMGGAIGSLGGALFAVKIGSLTPASFQVLVSIQVLGVVILGGLGSLPGVIAGALVLVGLPGLLREFEEYRLLAYGGALVGIMVLRPQGLIPNRRRSRELHEEEREQDKWAGDLAADEHVATPITPLGEGAG